MSLLVVHMTLKDKINEFTDIGGQILTTATKKAKKVTHTASKIIEAGKEDVYKGVSAVSQQMDEVKDSDLGQKVGEVASNVVDAVKNFNNDIQSKGGYGAVLKGVYKNVSVDLEQAANSIDSALFTDGEFDTKKAKSLLKNSKESVKLYGQKAVEGISELVGDAKDGVVNDYRSVIPTAEELSGKYAGIGTNYNGILIRKNYDKVLRFAKKINRVVPPQVRVKKDVLAEVKANAIQNKTELKTYFGEDEVKSRILRYL